MIWTTQIAAVMLKPIHLFFAGKYCCWFILVFNKNTQIFLVFLGFYFLLKKIYDRCLRFEKGIILEYKKIYKLFLNNFSSIFKLYEIFLLFWFFSFLFSNIDLILSYFWKIKTLRLFYLLEIIPYVFLFIKIPKIAINFIRGRDV